VRHAAAIGVSAAEVEVEETMVVAENAAGGLVDSSPVPVLESVLKTARSRPLLREEFLPGRFQQGSKQLPPESLPQMARWS